MMVVSKSDSKEIGFLHINIPNKFTKIGLLVYTMYFHNFLRVPKWMADTYSIKVICCLCCHIYRKAGMDGAYKQMHRRSAKKK